jgi:tRNA A-37 threonylcarbamoyl transferase component Bud32
VLRAKHCLGCGAPLEERIPGGLCARCALRGALDARPRENESEALTETGADRAAVSVPRRFGDYELLEEIGRGGMGVVYKARQVALNRVVAVKMIRAERLARREDVYRFRTEAEAAARLQHPNIVAIHEAGTIDGQHFYSMDFVEGRTLADLVRDRPLPAPKAARMVKAVAEAIHYAHGRGVLHRDLKPSNILIGRDGAPRVADFGLAKVLRDQPAATMTGEVFGSPSYMAPEQAAGRGRETNVRTDVYALGAILYELICGRAPFRAGTSFETLRLVLETDPVAPRLLNPLLPRDIETICLKCLAKAPGRRYGTAQSLADDLGRFLDNEPIVARPVGAAERLWRWCQRNPLAAGLAAGLFVAWLWNLSRTLLTPLLAGLVAGLALAGWFGWQAHLSSRKLRREEMERAIDAALAAAWALDRTAADEAIQEAVQHGAPAEWVHMLNAQVALFALPPDAAIGHLEQAVSLAPRSVAARAMLAAAFLWKGDADRYGELLGQLEPFSPITAADYLLLGAALVAGHRDTSRAVALLERALQMRPSGIVFQQLAMAEGFHSADIGSWPMARRAMDHSESAGMILGRGHPSVLLVRANACNFAMRLCPDWEHASVLEQATEAARALESTASPLGHIQRAFYFQIVGDEEAQATELQQPVQHGASGLFAIWYAAAMYGRRRSAEAMNLLGGLGPAPDPLAAVARAYLLIDLNLPARAEDDYRLVAAKVGFASVLAETIPLLAGDEGRAAANCVRLLDVVPPQHDDYQSLRYLAGRLSAEDLLASAGESRCRQCNAHYYIGMSLLARGEREAARAQFNRSVETGTHWLVEFQWSRAFLARMNQNDGPPR